MGNESSDENAAARQLTLDDWAEVMQAQPPRSPGVVYHVSPAGAGHWKVTLEDGGLVSVHPTRREALLEARRLGSTELGGNVVVHHADGRVETTWSADSTSPPA